MRQKRKKITYKKSIIVGFLVLYVATMFLSTYLLKCRYAEEYYNYLFERRNEYARYFESDDVYLGTNEEEQKDNIQSYAAMRLSMIGGKDEYQQISGSLYDFSGDLCAVTEDIIGTVRYQMQPVSGEQNKEDGQGISYDTLPAETIYEYFPVKDYLSEGEMQKLFEYRDTLNVDMTYEEAVERYGEAFVKMEDPAYKRHSMNLMLDNSFELIGIEIEEKIIKLSDGAHSEPEEARIVWEWKKENEEGNPESIHFYTGEMIFPYHSLGESARRRWEKDEWMQGYQEKINDLGQFAKEKGTNSQGQICQIVLFGKTEEDQYGDSRQYLLVLRETSHPWLAATQDMKYVYLAGAVLTLACMINVIYSTHKTYQEREKLESMRRDFTNAAAHELKTPLSVIRGFAENLKEDTIKEKREYYLDQIIDQTEQIDNLVKEMIHISKMDSDVILQNRQQYSLVELVKEQMNKLHLQIEEKNLHILYEVEQEFLVEADLDKMGRAIWNLLSNAVEYNRLDGSIWIFSEKDKLTIENTGEAIPEDALPHVFEMFYTGDESRHERSIHMGLGLYLAKRICEMHALKIEICNTDEGVKITISR